MNRMTLMFEFPVDGGTVLYADNGDGTDMALVFAGNQKEALDYVAKRVDTYGKHPPFKAGRTVREFATDAFELRRIDEATRYAVEA